MWPFRITGLCRLLPVVRKHFTWVSESAFLAPSSHRYFPTIQPRPHLDLLRLKEERGYGYSCICMKKILGTPFLLLKDAAIAYYDASCHSLPPQDHGLYISTSLRPLPDPRNSCRMCGSCSWLNTIVLLLASWCIPDVPRQDCIRRIPNHLNQGADLHLRLRYRQFSLTDTHPFMDHHA
jgi:hypothetical protein